MEKEKIKLSLDRLTDSVENFNSTLDSVQEVIEGLKVVANTCGGHQRNDQISQIANMDINKREIACMKEDISNIKIITDIHKKYF